MIAKYRWIAPALFLLAPVTHGDEVDFARDVQPILSNNCYACHGPDEGERAAELRLDTEVGARSVLDLENPAASEMLHRIATKDPDEQMPPPKKKEALKPEEIQILKRWIEQGAKWGTHWAFEVPVKPPVPQVEDSSHPIDAFVLSKLQKENLAPSPSAPKSKWLRRVSLDLTGLPPSLEELDQFLGDSSPNARQKAVHKLLESPHFGERWARWWMDAARYADSNGYEKDSVRYVWPWRDWVINAFNDNLPYDQFVIKQVAGDLLPGATMLDKVATGFLRNSMVNEEGAIKYEQFRVEGIFDRVDAIGKSILGLTMQCAQCHTHKYDPIRQEEYYGLFAYLNNAHESTVPYYTKKERDQITELHTELETVRQQIKSSRKDWANELHTWVEKSKSQFSTEPEWTVVTPELIGDGGQKFYSRSDGSLITMGYSPAKSTEKFAGQTKLKTVNSLRLELLTDPYLTYEGPGRSLEGSAALSELKLFAGPDPDSLKPVAFEPAKADLDRPPRPIDSEKYPWKNGDANSDRIEGPAAFATDGDLKTAWATETNRSETNQPRVLVVNLKQPLHHSGAKPLYLRFEVACQHGGWNSNDNHHRNLGRFRFSLSPQRFPEHNPETPLVRQAIEKDPSARTTEESNRILDAWVKVNPALEKQSNEMESIRSRHPEPTPQLVAKERTGTKRTTRLFDRGEQQHPKQKVVPHVPEFLHNLPAGRNPESRLTFAQWLVDRDAPTTARTIVNRTWQAIFGIGIVESVEDLGHQALPASHPELLDWLSVEFMDSGWDFKHLLELIVTSDTYARDSRLRPDLAERDPRNRLLARAPRFCPHAEVVRDTQLAVSGLLNRDIGGESVFPPIPSFLFNPPVSYGYKIWNEDKEPEKRYRRALYTFRFRTVPPPFLSAFDAPTGEIACVRRPQSTTPLQALATLNEPLSMEAAKALGNEIRATKGSLEAALSKAFRRCTSRAPEPDELAVLVELFEREKQSADGDPYTTVARVLLNLDETITRS
ncbi:MAG: PSD1 and planctomycete cytochrome C domain-containing protein [Verrucomicrobiales bacterium]|nr:PSD1 and planctomycete cytochrome C domain-containing protein [Verrucomicrobiales bacterium]